MEYAVETEPPHPAGDGRVGGLKRASSGHTWGRQLSGPFFAVREGVKQETEGA